MESGSPQWDRLVVFAASAMGLVAAAAVILKRTGGDTVILVDVLSVVTIFCSWLMLQTGFTRLYADQYFRPHPAGGLDFPKTNAPGLIEFVYFGFGIGATYQVSDVEATTSPMRLLITAHAIVGFFYNSVILALAINIIMSV